MRFKGRGIFQTTGRANYLQLGIKKNRRYLFINNPELLEQPEYAVWSACEYWRARGLTDIANHADSDVLKKKASPAVRSVPAPRSKRAKMPARPIEPTRSGLRPPRAAQVK